jgi:diacylglycerol O-acyltransferase
MRVLGVGRLAAMLLLESVRLTKNAIALPFVSTARTPLTGQVTPGRQFTTAAVYRWSGSTPSARAPAPR